MNTQYACTRPKGEERPDRSATQRIRNKMIFFLVCWCSRSHVLGDVSLLAAFFFHSLVAGPETDRPPHRARKRASRDQSIRWTYQPTFNPCCVHGRSHPHANQGSASAQLERVMAHGVQNFLKHPRPIFLQGRRPKASGSLQSPKRAIGFGRG